MIKNNKKALTVDFFCANLVCVAIPSNFVCKHPCIIQIIKTVEQTLCRDEVKHLKEKKFQRRINQDAVRNYA